MLESKQKKWSAAAAPGGAGKQVGVPDKYWVFEDAGVIADRFLRGVEYLRESLSVLRRPRALLASQHIVGGGKVGAVATPKGTGVLFGR